MKVLHILWAAIEPLNFIIAVLPVEDHCEESKEESEDRLFVKFVRDRSASPSGSTSTAAASRPEAIYAEISEVKFASNNDTGPPVRPARRKSPAVVAKAASSSLSSGEASGPPSLEHLTDSRRSSQSTVIERRPSQNLSDRSDH